MANLVTKDDYKRFKGLSSNGEDARIDQLVRSISALVKTYCGLSFIDYFSTDKTETFTIRELGTDSLFLDEQPIVSITSVKERISQSSDYTTLVKTTPFEYYTDDELGILYRVNDVTPISFPKGPNSVEVTYKSGYENTPKDLELAVYDLITYYLKSEHKKEQSIGSTTITNTNTTSISGDIGFPDHIRRVLDLYKVNII